MYRWLNHILKTVRVAVFAFAACALQASGVYAQQEGAGEPQTLKPLAAVRAITAEANSPSGNPLQATPPAVAPDYEAPARALPSFQRVGVEVSDTLPLSLEEAIRMALENNNDIDASRIEVGIAERGLTAARGAYDVRLTSETYFERSTTPTASFLGGGRDGSIKSRDVTGKIGFEGLSPRAGGSYRFEFSSRRLSSNNVFNDINPTISNGFTLSYTQPLLRGRRTDDTRRRIEIAKKNLSLTDAQFRRRATEVITNVEQAYWELAYALRNLQVQIEAVSQARAQQQSTVRQVERGVLAPVDVLEAETQVKNFEQGVYSAQESVGRAENALKMMLSADRRAELWSKALLPVTPVDLSAPRVALEEAVTSALANRLELAELTTSADINKIDQRFYRDQTRPQVDLTASYSSNALAGSLRDDGDNPIVSGLASLQNRINELSALSGMPALPATAFGTPNGDLIGGYGKSLSNLFAQTNPTLRVGVRLSFPLRNRTAGANYGRALDEGRRIENRRAQQEQAIEVEVRNTMQTLRSVEGRLAAAAAARSSAEQQYESESRKFHTGASTAYMVSQRRIDLVAARGRELQAQTDLNKAIADFRRATGGTLESHNVAVRPGDPARKFQTTSRPVTSLPASTESGFEKE